MLVSTGFIDALCGAHLAFFRAKKGIGQLPSAVSAIRSSEGELEERFLRVVNGFETISEKTRMAEADSDRVVEAISGGEGSEAIQEGFDLVARHLEEIEGKGAEVETLLSTVQNHALRIDNLMAIRDRIEETVSPFVYIRTLLRVESVALPQEYRVVFESLANEMEALCRRVDDALAEQFISLEQTKRELEESLGLLESEIQSGNERVGKMREHMSKNAVLLENIVSECKRSNSRLRASSGEMVRSMGQLGIGLQFHDIVSQRFSHIEAAFDQMVKDSDVGWRLSNGDTCAYVNHASKLQLAQISGVEAELEKAEKEIGRGLKGVRNSNEVLRKEATGASEMSDHTATAGGVVDVVHEQVQAMSTVLDIYSHIHGEAERVIRPLGSMTSDLTSTLVNITMGIRLVALNAQVYAAQIGEGSGLEALASQTREISDEMLKLGEELSQELDTLNQGFKTSVERMGELMIETESQRARLEVDGNSVVGDLHKMRDVMIRGMLNLMTVADVVEEQLQAVADDVKFAAQFAQPIQSTRSALELIVSHTVEVVDRTKMSHTTLERLDALKANYTMSDEREIHMTTTSVIYTERDEGLATIDDEVKNEEPKVAEFEEDPLAGIDLFDDEPAEDSPKKEEPKSREDPLAGVDLFDEDPLAGVDLFDDDSSSNEHAPSEEMKKKDDPRKDDKKKSVGGDFGDNVDLF